ncbi:MAG: hypothetical protein LIO68_07755, partial [Rikenellaceae bacterium]|nr:hypothetical protein [Rikenellaceae bacterium]
VLSNRCDYVFSVNSNDFDNKPEWRIADEKVHAAFGQKNTIAVRVPRGDYHNEGRVLRRVSLRALINSGGLHLSGGAPTTGPPASLFP